MRRYFGQSQHLVRAGILLLAGLVAFLFLRALFVPKDFGTYGHFRAGALADNAGRPMHFAGRAACEECHTDVVAARQGSKHEKIGCEACHGPLAAHAADPGAVTPELPDAKTICLRCHLHKVSAPASFPQIDPKEHGDGQACNTCHVPHHPDVQ